MAGKKVKCPVCEVIFEVETDMEVGDTISCSDCYAELKIVKLNPLQVEEAVSDFSDDDDEKEDSEDKW
ncbi:MAG: hypothetical protein KKC11_04200 [Candidatus Omnitrophica bacterium]|nr:hypothetical protein [Candidatus Omnitrophota bacterium]MBU0878420.1 hypothetical protein [Candidatus Omnitrophota bacterium]MBU0896230.1 hypothetical protein [Candidatus Omnitrophota bacterium]MBU1133878.1 hypothetical protein [Candidatus Omnitrophota bacterium]MBU1367452.1 hypothetical protein [Candidatus Omnitrophota bacterium]